jgi:hypothetical protein
MSCIADTLLHVLAGNLIYRNPRHTCDGSSETP